MIQQWVIEWAIVNFTVAPLSKLSAIIGKSSGIYDWYWFDGSAVSPTGGVNVCAVGAPSEYGLLFCNGTYDASSFSQIMGSYSGSIV